MFFCCTVFQCFFSIKLSIPLSLKKFLNIGLINQRGTTSSQVHQYTMRIGHKFELATGIKTNLYFMLEIIGVFDNYIVSFNHEFWFFSQFGCFLVGTLNYNYNVQLFRWSSFLLALFAFLLPALWKRFRRWLHKSCIS